MPSSAEARRAFERKINEILATADDLSETAVRDLLRLLDAVQDEITAALSRIPADSFSARHLAQLRLTAARAFNDVIARYRTQFPGILELAWQLGIDLAEDPFLQAGILLPGLAPRTLLEVLAQYSADLITNLEAEALRRVNAVLSRTALGVITPYDAIQQIAGTLPGPSVFTTVKARAEAIVRTEVNRALEVANQARLADVSERIPGMKKQWLSAGDQRVRATHKLANGQIVDAKAKFVVGGFYASFPRDPSLPAGESVNCRCHSIPYLDAETLNANFGIGIPPVPAF